MFLDLLCGVVFAPLALGGWSLPVTVGPPVGCGRGRGVKRGWLDAPVLVCSALPGVAVTGRDRSALSPFPEPEARWRHRVSPGCQPLPAGRRSEVSAGGEQPPQETAEHGGRDGRGDV